MADDPENKVVLTVGGQRHDGWKAVSVSLGLDGQLSGGFTLTVSEGWLDAGQLRRLPIAAGSACTLGIDGETVITGWVDTVTPTFSDSEHTVNVTGRDRAGDLLDCSAAVKEWRGAKLETIAGDLSRPFDVAVRAETDTGPPFGRFAVNPGDTVADTIERLCRQRGVLAWSDGLGGLIIGRGAAGQPVAALARGVNLLSAQGGDDASQRYSEVIVRGSREGGDDVDGEDTAQAEGRATDPGIRRHRPLILIAETQGAAVSLAERAAWEVRTRRGKGRRITARVRGWHHAGGLWRPGQTVSLADDWLGVDGLFVVGEVVLDKSEQGTVAGLVLYPPEAFDRLAEPEKDTGGGEDDE